jgi:serine/threonine-protein kinase HipA
MAVVAEVRLWGSTIGAVAVDGPGVVATFQYDGSFVRSGIQVSPLQMPLRSQPYQFPELSMQTFHGLPGMLADALPDAFGNAVLSSWLMSQGRHPSTLSAVERLCYTGNRGMGALEFYPTHGPNNVGSEDVQIEALVHLASKVLQQRSAFTDHLDTPGLQRLLHVGTSAGGARAKAVLAWNESTGELKSGQIPAAEGFEYWILKFDGVVGNRDKELEDPQGYGAVEYAYSLMAKAAGIHMTECRLMADHGRHHFMTRRFDRLADGDKLHVQSLCAMAHLDYNAAGAHSYEQALSVARLLQLDVDEQQQLFRRLVFNVVARNQDDHTKNIAFLMDRSGRWFLAPAFDVTWAYNPQGDWTSMHQMTINGKRDNFSIADLTQCARTASISSRTAASIIADVTNAVLQWPLFAAESGVDPSWIDAIQQTHRLTLPRR